MSNFAYTYLSGTHTSASTTFTVTTGEGSSRFTANKYATVWNTTDYPNAAAAFWASPKQAEVVLIGTPATSSTTVTRAQLGTTAISFTANKVYQLFEGVFDALVLPVTRTNGHFLKSDGTNWAGAALAASDIASGTMATARLGSGSAGATNYLRGDQSWQVITIPTYVDIPMIFVMPSTFAAQATNYSALGGGGGFSSAESGVVYSAIGITGTVVGMYWQSKTNTMSETTTVTLQSGAADAASLTPSSVVISLTATTKNGSDVAHTLAVTPTTILGLKFVNASGSGSITLISVTLVVRCSLA